MLSSLGELLRSFGRSDDYAARYGGEEFAMILPRIKPGDAFRVADRLRTRVQDLVSHTPAGPLRITVSVGVATLPDSDLDADRLVELSDRALYRSKTEGRNRTSIADS